MPDLRELYQEVILDHNKSPRNFGPLENADRQAEGFNPLCGDHYFVYLNLGEDGKVADVAFDGSGCAISKAAASMMTTMVKGKTPEEVLELFSSYRTMVTGETAEAPATPEMKRLAVFSEVSRYPARVKCAILAWHTLVSALGNDAETVTTE